MQTENSFSGDPENEDNGQETAGLNDLQTQFEELREEVDDLKFSKELETLDDAQRERVATRTFERIFEETDYFRRVEQLGLRKYITDLEFLTDKERGNINGISLKNPSWFRKFCGAPNSYSVFGGVNLTDIDSMIKLEDTLRSLAYNGQFPKALNTRIHEYAHYGQMPNLLKAIFTSNNSAFLETDAVMHEIKGIKQIDTTVDSISKIAAYRANPDSVEYAYNVLQLLNVIGVEDPDIIEFLRRPGRWKGKSDRPHFTNIDRKLRKILNEKGIDESKLPQMIEEFRTQREIERMKAMKIVREEIGAEVKTNTEIPIEEIL